MFLHIVDFPPCDPDHVACVSFSPNGESLALGEGGGGVGGERGEGRGTEGRGEHIPHPPPVRYTGA